MNLLHGSILLFKLSIIPFLPNKIWSAKEDKLKNVKEGLKVWSKVKFVRNDRDIESLKNEVTKWEIVAESRDLEVVELERWKEARRDWTKKDKCSCEESKSLGKDIRLRHWLEVFGCVCEISIRYRAYVMVQPPKCHSVIANGKVKFIETCQIGNGHFKLEQDVDEEEVDGFRVQNREIEAFANHIGILSRKMPFTYVGFHIGVNMERVDSWNIVVEKFWKRSRDRKKNDIVAWENNASKVDQHELKIVWCDHFKSCQKAKRWEDVPEEWSSNT
ncbi:hypothetical protein Tco_1092981 [Tanacetum coccineum]|uniref:Uncharacterized protein n=1 Tax=Tanacetum coccineum TaxID=301880 RepID=A0ABQ5IDJ1_9ASTR